MLTPTQTNYLSKLPTEILQKPVQIYPWTSKGLEVAEKIINEIKSAIPERKVIFIGSMALHIAGQRDIDLSVLCPFQDFVEPHKALEKLFGPPDKIGQTHIAWHFIKEGYEIGIYLTDPVESKVQEQIDIFNILKNDSRLLKEYEDLKLAANGLPYREYQIKKYDFYNRVLGLNI